MRGNRREGRVVKRPIKWEPVIVFFAVTMLVAGLTTLIVFPDKKQTPKKPNPTATAAATPLEPVIPDQPTPGPGVSLKEVESEEPIRVATANIYKRLSWSGAAADLSRLTDSSTDLIGLNEISPGRAASIRAWAASRPGWHFYSPPASPTPFRTANSLLWNDAKLVLLDAGSEYGSHSATRTYAVDSRWITWAKFRVRKTGTKLYFLVTHMDPAVERRGVPRPNRTVRANQIYMAKLKSFAEQLVKTRRKRAVAPNVIIVGDWNVNALADRRVKAAVLPFSTLEGRGEGPIISNYTALGFSFPPTSPKSRRWIDYVALWVKLPLGSPQLSFDKQYSLRPVNSDHNPVVVDLTLKHSRLKVVRQAPRPSPQPSPTPVAAG
jgi:endonuclease/exonuclease/phosphatase family metal-dependent hydrolase